MLDALRSGCFYASTGPLITDVKVARRDGRGALQPVQVGHAQHRPLERCSSARRQARVWLGAEIDETTDEGLIVAATLALPETAPYARIEVVDALGRTAWSNPVDQF